jgi:predicted anti-sigma-YlaC factor YlaD
MSKYWFKPKRYGYGATPVTWEGWALAAAAVAIILVATVMVTRPDQVGPAAWIIWSATFSITIGALWVISRLKTEGVWRWRWGKD